MDLLATYNFSYAGGVWRIIMDGNRARFYQFVDGPWPLNCMTEVAIGADGLLLPDDGTEFGWPGLIGTVNAFLPVIEVMEA